MKDLISLFRGVLAIFPSGGRRFVLIYGWLLASLSILDVAALGLLAVIIGPLAAGQPVVFPLIGELSQTDIAWAALLVCALIVLKSIVSILITRWGLSRIARYEVAIGDRLFRAYINAPWMTRLRRNSSDMLRFADSGSDAAVNSFVVPGSTLIGEAVTLSAVIITLAVVQPGLAAVTIAYVAVLGLLLQLWSGNRSRRAGEAYVSAIVRTGRLVLEIVGAMKEVTLRNKEDEVSRVVESSRKRTAAARADLAFVQGIPRYALEAGLIGGFVVAGGVGLLLGGVEQALTFVALFALAGFRIAPSVVRAQTVVSGMLGTADFARRLLAELTEAERAVQLSVPEAEAEVPQDASSMVFENVSFRYSEDAEYALRNVSLEIPFGSTVAFVGESGSGKSTLVDLVLGLIEPTEGRVVVGDVPLPHLRRSWRERVAYVPQEVAIFDATVAQNVALTWSDDADPERVRRALKRAHLWGVVSRREGGIAAPVGERGLSLSGGQRQRLGIARALYSEPRVLVMDEATSALDGKTESAVTRSVADLPSDVTVVVVAHRLSTIRSADRIFFLRKGEIVGAGTFDELVAELPDFAEQAHLAGLT